MSNSFSQDIIFPKQLNEFNCSTILLSITILVLTGSKVKAIYIVDGETGNDLQFADFVM